MSDASDAPDAPDARDGPGSPRSPRSPRPLGLWSASALVIGNIIGSGIFLLPAALAPYGGGSTLGWVWSFAGAMLLAVVFARLAARFPRAGGPYAYTRLAFGGTTGFLMAWSYWISCWAGSAAIAVAVAGSLHALVPAWLDQPWQLAACALAALWLATAVNLVGLRAAGSAQVTTVVLKVLPLLVIGLAALPHVDPSRLVPAAVPFGAGGPSWWSVAAATAALTLWAFQGLECATIPADQVTDAQRLVPRATLVGTAVAGLVTILACSAVMGLLPAADLARSSAPFPDAARVLWGAWAERVFATVAVISCLGALNGWVLVQGQIPAAAARDGLFPRFFAPTDARTDGAAPPRLALVISSVLATILVVANYTGSLVAVFTASILLATAAALLPYLMSAAATLWLRAAGRARFSAATLAVALGALLFSLWALWGTGAQALRWFAGLMLAGMAIHAARWIARRLGRRQTPG
ncbi:MAG TPA: amino acid permease [Kofleriaceae bacterium]|nr:amino acid permease [Kofleriaceae bacterium]